jgi:integrase
VYQPFYRDKRTGDRRKATTWWIQYSVKGRRFRESSNSRVLDEAECLLRERLEAAVRGEKVGPGTAKTTFARLIEILLNHYRVNGRRSVGRVEDAAIHLRRFFEGVNPDQIDRELVVRYISSRQNERAASATINRELAALRRAFKLAQSEGTLKSVPQISMLPEQSRPGKCIEDREYRVILDNLPEYLKPAIQTAYVTGWRINSEILTLQKHHLDLDSGCLRLVSARAVPSRRFPLPPELREVLAQQLQKTGKFERLSGKEVPWLFHRDGRPIKDFRKAWTVACERAGVRGRVPDDLRRSAVRNLEYAGVPRSIAMAMVGHRSDSIYRGIASTDRAVLKESALKIAAFHESRRSAQVQGDSAVSDSQKPSAKKI